MKLYHFCRASDLDSIAEKGLYPHVPTEPIMSLGEEVVWLTTQETTEVDETDIKHFHHLGLPKEQIERMARNCWLLDTNWTHRLTVRIRSGGTLKQYGEWLHFNRDRPIIENEVGRTNDRGEIYSVKHLISEPITKRIEHLVGLLRQNSAEHNRRTAGANKEIKEAQALDGRCGRKYRA